jgi:hypothetical protein
VAQPEDKDITGKNSGSATYDGSKTMPRHLSTPFVVDASFTRYVCLNFSNGAHV